MTNIETRSTSEPRVNDDGKDNESAPRVNDSTPSAWKNFPGHLQPIFKGWESIQAQTMSTTSDNIINGNNGYDPNYTDNNPRTARPTCGICSRTGHYSEQCWYDITKYDFDHYEWFCKAFDCIKLRRLPQWFRNEVKQSFKEWQMDNPTLNTQYRNQFFDELNDKKKSRNDR